MYRYQEKRFSLGNAMSSPPMRMGRKKFPKIVGMPGMTTRKIMMIPCRVNIGCRAAPERNVLSGESIWMRMRTPRITATVKKLSTATR